MPGQKARIVLGVGAALLVGGCGATHPFRTIEESVQAKLPQLIGPADHYDVTVSRSSGGLVAGRIPWLDIHGRNVRLQGMNLDELQVHLEGVRFNRSDRTVREIESSRIEARISAGSITQLIRQRSPGLRDVTVRVAGGRVQVHAAPALLGIGLPVDVEGRPVLQGPTAINFDADRFAVLRLGLPEFALHRLEACVNPLADLSSLSFPLQLTGVQIQRDRVVVSGIAHLTPAQLQASGGH